MQSNKDLQNIFPVWNQLTSTQQATLQKSLTERNFIKGATLHGGREDCSGLFIVKSGQLRVFILSEKGKEISLYHLFERDICLFSASCIMNNIHFEVYVQAEKNTSALLIPTSVYKELMKDSLPIASFTNQLMAARFSDVMWLIEQVVFTSFDHRLATFLAEQSNIEESDTLYITHEEIAHHMGTAREVVTRMLKYFQSEGIVALFRGSIKVVDSGKLKNLI